MLPGEVGVDVDAQPLALAQANPWRALLDPGAVERDLDAQPAKVLVGLANGDDLERLRVGGGDGLELAQRQALPLGHRLWPKPTAAVGTCSSPRASLIAWARLAALSATTAASRSAGPVVVSSKTSGSGASALGC